MLKRVWRKGSPHTLLVGMQIGAATMENCIEVSPPQKKLKIEFPYDPVAPLLGMYPDKMLIQKDKWYSIFRAELFTIVKTWKQPKCPLTDKWPEKYTHWNTTQP